MEPVVLAGKTGGGGDLQVCVWGPRPRDWVSKPGPRQAPRSFLAGVTRWCVSSAAPTSGPHCLASWQLKLSPDSLLGMDKTVWWARRTPGSCEVKRQHRHWGSTLAAPSCPLTSHSSQLMPGFSCPAMPMHQGTEISQATVWFVSWRLVCLSGHTLVSSSVEGVEKNKGPLSNCPGAHAWVSLELCYMCFSSIFYSFYLDTQEFSLLIVKWRKMFLKVYTS